MTVFEQAFRIVIGEEGVFSKDPADPGNWTGGACGGGICRGTKYGIAASAHPKLEISALTLEQAHALYQSDYWNILHASDLPPSLALLLFDAAVNCGTSRAIKWLQIALSCTVDGEMGPATIVAAQISITDNSATCAQFQALRLIWMTGLPTWRMFGLGWARRICSLPYKSLLMEQS